MARLTNEEITLLRNLYHKDRFTTPRLARTFHCSLSTVHYWLNHTQRQLRRAPAGPPDVQLQRRRTLVSQLATMTDATGEPIYPSARLIAAALYQRHNIIASRDTVRRDLITGGFVARVRPRITAYPTDSAKRLAFATAYQGVDPSTIAFSDEKIFDTNHHGHRRAWIPKGTSPKGRLVSRWPNRVHVWGCIGHNFKMLVVLKSGERLDRDKYVRSILAKCVPELRSRNLTFLQDGAACHRAAIPYLNGKNVPLVQDYPPRSPDMNVIETLWANLQRRVWAKRPITCADLVRSIREAWEEIPQYEIDNLIKTWPARLHKVIANNGTMST